MNSIIILNPNGVRRIITPIFTSHQAGGRDFVPGEDKHGKFIACRLDNQVGTKLYGWYVLVSPEDLVIMQRNSWSGNICGSSPFQGFEVRRFIGSGDDRIDFRLNHVIWERTHGSDVARIASVGHPLDLRRDRLMLAPNPNPKKRSAQAA